MTKFQQSVVDVVNLVPPGKVVSYGQVALYIGLPRAAREVGWTLRSIDDIHNIPWWRVINNAGVISIKGNINADANLQRKLLENESIEVNDSFEVDIEKYRWLASKQDLKKLSLDEDYIQLVLNKYTNQGKLI